MADQLKNAFNFFDEDKNGGVTLPELTDAFNKIGASFSEEQVSAFFKKYDADNNGELDFDEFLALSMSIEGAGNAAAVQSLFQNIDGDGNKSLSHAELRSGLAKFSGKSISDTEVAALIKQLDIDGDGEISYEEFTKNFLSKLMVAVSGASK